MKEHSPDQPGVAWSHPLLPPGGGLADPVLPLCEEMRRIVNDEGYIGAEGRAKDDRVMGAALAYQGWNMWVQPRVKAQGLSVQKSAELEERGGTDPMERVISNYLKRVNIKVPL